MTPQDAFMVWLFPYLASSLGLSLLALSGLGAYTWSLKGRLKAESCGKRS